MALIKEIDYGTPIRVSEQTVTLTIDGMHVTVPAGTSICEALLDNKINIEHACDMSCACTTCHHCPSSVTTWCCPHHTGG